MNDKKHRLCIVNGLGERIEFNQMIRDETLEKKKTKIDECKSVEVKQVFLERVAEELLWEMHGRMSVLYETLHNAMNETKVIHDILENSLFPTLGPRALEDAYNIVFQNKPKLRESCTDLYETITILRRWIDNTMEQVDETSALFGER